MIVMRVNLEKIPENCMECMMCNKPMNRYSKKLVKKYYNKRHEKCPLMKIEVEGEVK